MRDLVEFAESGLEHAQHPRCLRQVSAEPAKPFVHWFLEHLRRDSTLSTSRSSWGADSSKRLRGVRLVVA
jgi:hypothetical protein